MTLFEWADRNAIRLPPPNNLGDVCIVDIDTLEREERDLLANLTDYKIVRRMRTAVWMALTETTGARSSTKNKGKK